MSLRDDIEAAVKRVETARSAAVQALEGKFIKLPQVTARIDALRGTYAEQVSGWGQRGRAGVTAKDFNAKGWFDAGEILLKGIAEARADGETATLADLQATGQDVKKDVVKVAKQAKAVAKEVASTAGEVAAGAVKPLFPALGMIALAAGGLGALYLIARKSL